MIIILSLFITVKIKQQVIRLFNVCFLLNLIEGGRRVYGRKYKTI